MSLNGQRLLRFALRPYSGIKHTGVFNKSLKKQKRALFRVLEIAIIFGIVSKDVCCFVLSRDNEILRPWCLLLSLSSLSPTNIWEVSVSAVEMPKAQPKMIARMFNTL
jgi:hypothetical protein